MVFSESKPWSPPLLYPFIIICYLIIIFFPSFSGHGPLLQTDQPLWATIAHLMRTEIFPDQRWFWNIIFDQGGAGKTMGKTYSIPIILPWLFTSFVSAATAVKLSTFISALFFLLSFFYTAKLFLSRNYALLCTLVILTPMFDNLVSGMWYNYFALGCGLSFWLSCHYFLLNRSPAPIICGAVSLALSCYAHPVGVVLCATVFIAYLLIIALSDSSNKFTLYGFLLLMFCSGILLAFPQIQAVLGLDAGPYVKPSGHHIRPPIEITGTVETLRRLFFIRIWGAVAESKVYFLSILVNIAAVWILVFLGIVSLGKEKRYEKIIPLGCLIVITAILISRVYNFLNIDIGLLRSLSNFYDRFQLLSQIYLILLAGIGLQSLAARVRQKTVTRIIYFVLITSLIYIAMITPKKIYWNQTGQLETLSTSILSSDVNDLWQWLARNVRIDEERVYFEDTYGKFQWNDSSSPETFRSHILALTSTKTKVRQIGGWTGYSTSFARTYEQGTIFGKSIHDTGFTDQFILDRLVTLNCRYIVVNSDIVSERLQQMTALDEVQRFGIFRVFKYPEMTPAWAYNTVTGDKTDFIRHSASHFELTATGKAGDQLFISMAYHPHYVAEYKNNTIPITNTEYLMSIRLPVDGRQSIHFRYVFNRQLPLSVVAAGLLLLTLTATAAGIYPGRQHKPHTQSQNNPGN